MASFKVAIVFSGRHVATSNLEDRLQTLETLTRNPNCRCFRYPDHDPVVYLYADLAQEPALKTHFSHDGSFLIIDGEIYNLDEINDAHNPASRGEAAALFDLYRSQGEALFERVDAAASIIIWDSQQERLIVLRDRWGAVPSYYATDNDVLFWASSVPTLLQVLVSRGVNLPAMDHFLGTGHIPAPWTFASGISKLPPAHILIAGPGSSQRIVRYCRPTGKPKRNIGPDETTESLDFLLKKSLRRRARPGERLGLLLSGGVDSKLLAATLHDIGMPFRAYTFRYLDCPDDGCNESSEASRAARHLGIPFQEVHFEPRDISDNLEWMVKTQGEPFAHGVHSSMAWRIGTDGVTTLLHGGGADLWYPQPWDLLSLKFSRFPCVMKDLAAWSFPLLRRLGSAPQLSLLPRISAKARTLADRGEIISWGERLGISPRFAGIWNPRPNRSSIYRDKAWVCEARQQVDELLEEVRHNFLDESKSDQIVLTSRRIFSAEGTLYYSHWWSRGAGLQLRTPYFDLDLDKFVMQLPRTSANKEDLRRLAEKYVGRDMAYSPKHGQILPLEHWFKTCLKDFLIDQLSPSRLERSGLFCTSTVQTMIDQHLRGNANHAFRLWPIITILTWQELTSSGDW